MRSVPLRAERQLALCERPSWGSIGDHAAAKTPQRSVQPERHGALKLRKGLGRLRLVQTGGVRTILKLGAAKGAAKGVLLAAATPGWPTVVVRGRKISIQGLPAGTGIVELTLYHRGAKLLHAKPRLTAGITGSGAPATLKTKLQRVAGR